MGWDCFVSYASADREHAQGLHAQLEAAGFTVWFDQYELRDQLGEQWHRRIEEGCNQSRIVIPVLTPRWKGSEWTRYETYGAEAVIPWLAGGTWDEVRTPPLSLWQGDLTGANDFDRLVISLRRLLAHPAPDYSERIAHMRYRPTQYFVGREKELNQIHERLFTTPTTVLTPGRVAAVTALGGLGKTTLARQYAEKFWRCYRELYWADCGNLTGELARIHDTLRPDPKLAHLKDTEKASWVLYELSQRDRPLRLVILDNAEDEDSIKEWIPKTGNCHTLITSRFTAWSHGVEVCPVWVLDPEPARDLLMRRSGRNDPDGANALAKKLGYLPLALEQAAGYIAEAGGGFAEYLRMYDRYERELLSFRMPGATDYPAPVYLTWRATIEKLSPGARAVLRLCSFFAPAPIPAGMLVSGTAILALQAQDMNLPLAEEPNEFTANRWRMDLARYSMIRHAADRAFIIHALVQAVERGQTPQPDRSGTIERAIKLLMAWAPSDTTDFHNWPVWRLIEPHARAVWAAMTAGDPVQADVGFLDCLGNYLQLAEAAYSDAEPMLRAALEAVERALGPADPITLMSVNNLGLLYEHEGRYDAAEELYQRALSGRERVLGPEHEDTVTSRSNLAGLYESQGRYDDAEPLHQESLRVRERVLGPDHPDTLASVNNLAFIYLKQGRYDEAEALYLRCLSSYDRVLSPDDPQTLLSVNSLAILYASQGRHKDAEALYQRALRDRERVLGPEHPDTLASLNGWLCCSRIWNVIRRRRACFGGGSLPASVCWGRTIRIRLIS